MTNGHAGANNQAAGGDLELAARMCAAVSRSFSADSGTPDDWTSNSASDLRELICAASGVFVMIAQWKDGAGQWETISLGLAGDYPEGAVNALHREAERGWPHDDVSRTLGHAGPIPPHACARRDELITDRLWRGSAYYEFRTGIGLHDFARAILPFEDPSGKRTLVLQIDGVHETWRAGTQALGTLSCIMCPALDAFRARFVEPRAARAKVLENLSPTQRRIVPLLAEGLTEAQIAERLNRSTHTVHDHTRSIYRALEVKSRLELRDKWLGRA